MNPKIVSTPLNDFESKLFIYKGGISACSLFKTEDKAQTQKYIEERFQSIVQANPWLKGMAVRNKKEKRIHLDFDPQETDITPIFHSINASQSISETSSYKEILAVCEPFIIPKAFKLVGKKNTLAKLVLVHLDENRFLVMFSLSHLIGDGQTFYEIFNMLSSQTDVRPLAVERKDEMKKSEEYISKKYSRFFLTPKMFFWGFHEVLSKNKIVIKDFLLNEDYIQSQKKEFTAKNENSFISTNDIITSVYGSLCQSKLIMMAINFRKRIAEITQNDAGNYEEILLLDEANSNEPSKVRHLLSDMKNVVPTVELPTKGSLGNRNPVLITSWAGFSQGINIPQAEELLHSPLYSRSEITFDSCIVYRPTPKQVSVLLFMKKLKEEAVSKHPLFRAL